MLLRIHENFSHEDDKHEDGVDESICTGTEIQFAPPETLYLSDDGLSTAIPTGRSQSPDAVVAGPRHMSFPSHWIPLSPLPPGAGGIQERIPENQLV